MNVKINPGVIAPNTAHGRYEFDRLTAQPAREAYLDTCAVSVRIGKTDRILYSRAAARVMFKYSRVLEEIEKLERRYLDTGVVSRDAVHFTIPFNPDLNTSTGVWVKMIPAEDIAKMSLTDHVVTLATETENGK